MASITSWTRLEPRTRVDDPLAGLEARVHDPLWLLGRQWQLGEFEGEDAGSPVAAAIAVQHRAVTRYLPRAVEAGPAVDGEPFDGRRPLEALIAREAEPPDLRLRARAGQRLLDALGRGGFTDRRVHYLAVGAFQLAIDDDTRGFAAVIAGRVPDGLRLVPLVEADLPAAPAPLRAVLEEWLGWCRDRFGNGAGAWAPERLEYAFSLGAGDTVLVAPELKSGELDWHSFDVQPGASLGAGAAPTESTTTMVPTPVRYPGMPALRFWQFEDEQVSFGGVEAGPEDIGRLLFVEFALVGADDWFAVPLPLAVGSVHGVTRLEITDTFGRVTAVGPVDEGGAGGPRWSMFRPTGATQPLLVLPPSSPGALAGEAIEDVRFVRDEAANLGWAVERTIEGALGRAVDLHAREPAAAPPPSALLSYRVRTEVPSYWIPLVPHELSTGVMELRRGRLPGAADAPAARSRILAGTSFLREEELPREGLELTRSWYYARWIDGSIHVWRRREAAPGSGTPQSGLAFDVVR